MALRIRECEKGDFEQVVLLLGQLWPEKALDEKELREVFQKGLNSEFQCYVCAVMDELIVGFASLSIRNSLWQAGLLGHIDELVVDKDHQGKGIGSKLLEYLAGIAKEKNCRRIELDSALDRKKAHQFYEQNGFENRAFLFSRNLS